MSQAIAIFGHWHAGTSIVAKIFREAGMWCGDSSSFWIEKECGPQCEHSLANQIGDQIYNGTGTDLSGLETILRNHKEAAEKQDHRFFGFKITHILQHECFYKMIPVFEREWPGAFYVVVIRDPFEIVMSTSHDLNWSEYRIMRSFNSSLEGYQYMKVKHRATMFVHPFWADTIDVGNIFKYLGLNWNENLIKMFDSEKINSKSSYWPEEYQDFVDRHRESYLKMQSLLRMYNNV